MGKALKKIAKVALPAAAAFIPGIGPVGAAALGAAGGAIGGGGLKGALLGGVGAGVGNALGASSIFGNSAGTALDKVSGIAGLQGPTQGSGFLGSITGGGGLSSALSGGGSGVSLNTLGTIGSGINTFMAQNEAEDELLRAQGRAASAYDPFYQSGMSANNQLSGRLSEGFNPGDLTQDPGYQFRLQEGNRALDRRLASSGMLDSGTALKAAQEYGQGLADQTYNDAYNRWLAQNQQFAGLSNQGFGAARGMAGIYDTEGDIRANATVGQANNINSTLSNLLSGSGAFRVIGYDPQGNPIYA